MRIQTLSVGYMGTNCYAVYDDNNTAVIIDPGFEADRIIDCIKSGYSVKAILLTHPHYDHFSACKEVAERLGAGVYCHTDAAETIINADNPKGMSVCLTKTPPIDNPITFEDGDTIKIGGLDISVMYTPGHCEGSCCFIIGDNIFTGDCLFRLEIGRCDLPTGDYGTMLKSLVRLKKLFDSKGDKNVYPGHGPDSTLEFEINNNSYIKVAVRRLGE